MSDRIYGPYAERAGFRVTVAREGAKRSSVFETELEALAYIREVKEAFAERTVGDLIGEFLTHLEERGSAASTRATVGYRLRGMLAAVSNHRPQDLLESRCQALYRVYRETHAPDTHRGALSITKALFEWARKKKRIKLSPWLDVDPLDKKRKRKDQLRIDEARLLYRWALRAAESDDGALAVLLALIMGLRAHEVVGIVARDLDDDGKLLHIAKSKTASGVRVLVIPLALRAHLARRAELRSGRLLPYKPGWVRDNTKRACEAAGVPVVCAQALRGTHATFALEAGDSGASVAKSLGHAPSRDQGTLRRHYALPGAGRSLEAVAAVDRLGETPSEPGYN